MQTYFLTSRNYRSRSSNCVQSNVASLKCDEFLGDEFLGCMVGVIDNVKRLNDGVAFV
ncbi:hypothetical protein [Novipirellula galeiformis]|nr:hypothetical protein [Novipirellula galeiformis]